MNAFFFLSPVAEPDLHDVTVHAKTVRHVADLLGARLGTRHEQRLQRLSQQLIDVRPLLAASRRHRVERQSHRRSNSRRAIADDTRGRCHSSERRGRRRIAAVDVAEPLLEQRLQLAHVLEAQIQSFKARNGRLREVIAVQLSHRHADITLRETCK